MHPAEQTHQQHIKVNYERTLPGYTHRQSRNNVNPTRKTQAGQHTGDEQLPCEGSNTPQGTKATTKEQWQWQLGKPHQVRPTSQDTRDTQQGQTA
jgi:hypothetical protein